MAILEILVYPDERLKQRSQEVEQFDAELRQQVQDMFDTMYESPGGIGLAAPQVGIFRRIITLDLTAKKKIQNHGCLVLINPEITHWEGSVVGREGCLSIPDYTANVVRAESIKLTACDVDGKIQQFDMVDFEARAVQHEIDHLNGLLFFDRIVSRRNDVFKRKVYK